MADLASPPPPWRIAGRYLESCNCEAICPCRRIGDVAGGRSTYGVCFGALSWMIDDGRCGEVDLTGLAVALVCRYFDDEPGAPWRFILHVDERGDDGQRALLADIFLGRLGGEGILALPWVRKPSELYEVRISPIEINHQPGGYELNVGGGAVAMRASRPVATDQRVSCVIPGHHRPGTELYADTLKVEEQPFEWDLQGNCAFVTEFDYSSQ